MRVLLDTCVISEIKRKRPNHDVRNFIEGLPSKDIYLSVITLGEIEKGIQLLKESDRKTSLSRWLSSLENQYAHRILPVDIEISRIWGQITAQAHLKGKVLSVSDGLIAATAICNGLRLATRNVSDFENTPAFIVNPWD
ncbi:MAG: type II toxin-antitoxin system VapC family toxin [bacterium]|nr:type II toxin-antitoxin system VapC family toxin [bacterium]